MPGLNSLSDPHHCPSILSKASFCPITAYMCEDKKLSAFIAFCDCFFSCNDFSRVTSGADYYIVSTTRPIEYNNRKRFNNPRHQQIRKINKMGPRGLKIDYHGIILTVFNPTITSWMRVRVKKSTSDRFLKICVNLCCWLKICQSFLQNAQKTF